MTGRDSVTGREGAHASSVSGAGIADPSGAIRARARALGFDAVGIAAPEMAPRNRMRLDRFVDGGEYGTMGWMADPVMLERRRHPRALWPEVRAVIVLGTNYGPKENPLGLLDHKDRGAISAYARNADYHGVLKKRVKRLARWMVAELGGQVKVFVDTAPVLEKPLGQAAGLGWQGKHTNLVSRRWGNWLFLTEVFTTLELTPDRPETDHCGSCDACRRICPTDAFPSPYELDARRCISYLTIEHRGPIPEEFRAAMGNRIYGCDDCLAVCPWNKFADPTREPAFLPRAELTAPRLADFLAFDDAAFRAFFSGSPIKRIGRDRFLRNVLIAIGNSGAPESVPVLRPLLDDPSPLVRAMAVWALGRLDLVVFAQERAIREARESDAAVRAEWSAPDSGSAE